MSLNNIAVTHPPSVLRRTVASLVAFAKAIYNYETREFCGRNGLSLLKISLFYSVFFLMLGVFFVACLGVFIGTLDFHRPRYYSQHSAMAIRNKINPGLGFRPQIDPEDMLLAYSLRDADPRLKHLTQSLQTYLDKYSKKEEVHHPLDKHTCVSSDLNELRDQMAQGGSFCPFDYKELLRSTPCSPENMFGYGDGPCVAIKLNKIYSWLPEAYQAASDYPQVVKQVVERLPPQSPLAAADRSGIFVKCEGEYSADVDALRNSTIAYYSFDAFGNATTTEVGALPFFYFPFLNQPGYVSPHVFVHFRQLPSSQLINVVCRAFANNIDSSDKLNMRGMVRLQLFFDKRLTIPDQ